MSVNYERFPKLSEDFDSLALEGEVREPPVIMGVWTNVHGCVMSIGILQKAQNIKPCGGANVQNFIA